VSARLGRGLAAVLLLTGCSVASVETPDPAAVPSGSIGAHAAPATGPIVEVGSDSTLGIGWRFSVYPSADGWCTQLETGIVTRAGCGEILPEEGSAFGSVGTGDPLDGGVTVTEGIASAETVTVWLIAEDGRRSPATMLSLEEAELDAQAFVGFAPADVVVTHVMAVAFNGEVLETYELP
jgi:hypothetical protein